MSELKDDRERKQSTASKNWADSIRRRSSEVRTQLTNIIDGGLSYVGTYLPEAVQESFIGPRIWDDDTIERSMTSPKEDEEFISTEAGREWNVRIREAEAKKDQKKKEEKEQRDVFVDLEQPGKTRINDVTLSIPPEQIHVQTSVKNVSVGTLRSHATQKIRTGHGYVQISLPLVFTSLAQVNEQLVPLAYQLRKNPFCRVENAYLRKVLMPHVDDEKRALMFTLQSLNVHTVENLPTTIRCNLQLLWFNYLPYIRDIKYRKDFTLGQIANNSVRRQYAGPQTTDHMPIHESIPDTIKHAYSENGRHEQIRLIQRTGATREEKVNLYDQIQFPVDDPGDSFAWGEFAKGFSANLLFAGSSTEINPDTGEPYGREFGPDIPIEKTFSMSYEKFRKGDPPVEERAQWREEQRGPEIWSKIVTFFANESFNPIHVNVAFTNRIAQLPLLDQRLPTHQFIGSMDRELVVTFFVTEPGQNTLKIFSEYIEDFEKQVLKFRSFTKDRWMEIKNPIAKIAGLSKVVPERMDIQTVPGSPGSSIVRAFFSEYSPFAFREPRKVGGGIDAILRSLCQGIFNRLGGGDASSVLEILDSKTDRIRNIEKRLRRQTHLFPAAEDPFALVAPPVSDKAFRNQAKKEYEEQWAHLNSTYDDGLEAMHGIEGTDSYTPKQWLELIGAPEEDSLRWYEKLIFKEPGTHPLLWAAAEDIVLLTQNHKEGFAFASDEDVFGLKTVVSMGLVYQGENVNTKDQQRKMGRLKEDLYNTLFSWLTKDGGLNAEFPNLFAELSNQYRDLNSCYPDLDLPMHPATGEFTDLEPDFYIYNPTLLENSDEDASLDFDRALTDAAQLIRQDVITAPDLDRNEVVEFISTSYGNSGHGQAVNVSDMPRGTRDSKLYKALQDDEMDPIDQFLDVKVSPESIAESAKDAVRKQHQLGMRKAFPTFRLYFIKEGRDQITYEGFQEMWGGFAVKEIRFVASRKIPADLCVITMANLDGFLETDRLDDLREDIQQHDQDQVRLRGSEAEMIRYQKHYERMNHWVAHYNDMRATNVETAWVAKLMDWERQKPTPNSGGPLGTTPQHALLADGKEVLIADLRNSETSIRIACDVISLYAIDLAGYKSSFYYNEIALTQYRFPQHAADVFEAIAAQIRSTNVLPEDWYKRIQNQEVREFVQFLRPSKTAMAQSRKAALDRDIAGQVLRIRGHQTKLDALEGSKESASKQASEIPQVDHPGDSQSTISTADIKTLEKHRKEFTSASESLEGRISQERVILKQLKKEVEALKIERDHYVTRKLATQGILFSEGTDIVLKMGYSNDPEKLETVFAGHVTEAQPGPGEVIIVAQTFATELMQEIKGLDEDMTQKGNEHLYKLAEWILTMPEVKHFGRWQWRTESWEDEPEMRGNDKDPIDERAEVGGGIIRGLLSPFFEQRVANYLSRRFEFNNNPSDDNIYVVAGDTSADSLRASGHRFLAAAADLLSDTGGAPPPGDYFPYIEDFTLNKRTLWQGLLDLQYNFPGYVMGIRPYSEGTRRGTWWRNTLFFGLPDMSYLTKVPDPVTWERYRQRVTETRRLLNDSAFNLTADLILDVTETAGEIQRLDTARGTLRREHEEITKERREPFRRYHTITSYSDIIDNGIITTKRGVYNGVTLRGRDLEGPHTDGDIIRKKLAGMDESNIRWLYVDSDNARGKKGALFARSVLLEVMRDVYTGEITLLGKPEIRPYDVVYLHDNYNEMFGPVEVEQVVHTFSEDTGFITQIVPDLVVSTADQMKTSVMGPIGIYSYRHMLKLAGVDWKTADKDRTNWESLRKGVINVGQTLAVVGLLAAYPIYFLPMLIPLHYLNNWITAEERIRIQPVFHKGKPFVTGIEGFTNPETLNPVLNALNLLLKSATGKYEATNRFLANAFNPYSVEAYLEHGYYQLYHTP